MMSQLKFKDLVSQLPRGDRLTPKKPVAWINWKRKPNPCFVEPDLEIETNIQPNKTSVVVISAAGAVGKSTVAAELAYFTGASLWDLSKIQVGSGTFIGTIFSVYEDKGLGIKKDLGAGDTLIIIDALDEAQVRAGSSNFDAFLSDLIGILKQPRAKPVIILFARSETAEWIKLSFDTDSVPYASFQIANFSETQANDFIDKKLDSIRNEKKEPLSHRQQREPYEKARSKLFSLIYSLLGVSGAQAWNDIRAISFLGYAPVLEALADYLHYKNYINLFNELEKVANVVRDPWDFLAAVINKLLLRETGKIQNVIRPKLEGVAKNIGWAAWDDLYKEKDQCRRVLEFSLKLPSLQIDKTIPPLLAEEYEKIVRTDILPQHPFLGEGRRFANVVFRDFLYAWGLTHGHKDLSEALRKAMRDRQDPFLPSQLFSRFILRQNGDEFPVLDGQDFGVFYDSLLTRVESTDDISLTILQNGDSIHVSAVLDREGDAEIECEIEDTGHGVNIWRQLKNADIDIVIPIELGLEGQRFVLGPGVSLACSELSVCCDDLVIDVSEHVELRAHSYKPSAQNLRIKIRNGQSNGLTVFWPSISHPWALYRGSEIDTTLKLGDDTKGDALRKFILMFRRQRTRKVDTVLSARWAPDQLLIRNSLVDSALRLGILKKTGRGKNDFFEFNSEYDSLMTLLEGGKNLSENSQKFVDSFFKNN